MISISTLNGISVPDESLEFIPVVFGGNTPYFDWSVT